MCRLRVMAAAMVLVGVARVFGEKAAVPAEALSPEVQKAISELSAEDYKTRQAAMLKLQMALGEQMRALVSSDDPEVQSRLASLLQFNDGLTRWVLDTMKLPTDQGKAQLEFGLKPDVLPIIAMIFSADAQRRVEGVRALAKENSEKATPILARLLEDPDRAVYVAAMEAVWDRKPTDAVVDALWARAVESGFAGYRQQMQGVGQNVTFRGKNLGGTVYISNMYLRGMDAGIACDVLVNLKAPQVTEKLKTFMESLEKMANSNPWLLNSNTEQMKNVYRLVEVYKPKEGIAILYRMAAGPVRQRFPGQINMQKYYWSNRTAAMASVILATEQKPEDYQLKQMRQMGGMWTTSTEEDENNALKKLQEWVKAHGEKYGLKGDGGAATQPVDKAALQPAKAGAANVGAAVIQLQPPIQGRIELHMKQGDGE